MVANFPLRWGSSHFSLSRNGRCLYQWAVSNSMIVMLLIPHVEILRKLSLPEIWEMAFVLELFPLVYKISGETRKGQPE